jgi:hypothetical protein
MTRKFSSTSIATSLASTINSTATTITVATGTGSALMGGVTLAAGNVDQFLVALDVDTQNEEIVAVTGISGDTLTVVRAQAGTSGIAHTAGAVTKHVFTGDDATFFTAGVATANAAIAKSLVTTKGDIIAASASATPARVGAGSNGSSLLADTAATSGVTWSTAEIGKNILINGNCAINQRSSTGETLTTNAKFPVDRFFARRSSGTTGITSTPISSPGLDGFSSAIRTQRASGDTFTGIAYIGQTVETINSIPLQGKTVTLSFYARKGADYSPLSSVLNLRLYTGTGTDEAGIGGLYTGTASPIIGTATLTTSWQRFTFTATIASTATQAQLALLYIPTGTASTNDYFDVTGFQLEVGSVATPFVLAGGGNRAAELNLCCRYYERWTSLSANMRIGNGYATSATAARITVQFKTSKRVGPTSSDNALTALIDTSNNTFYTMTSYSLTEANAESITMTMNATSASFTAGEMIELATNNTTGAYQGWNSEIS